MFEMVKEFHQVFDIPARTELYYPTLEEIELRLRLIKEEHDEIIDAIERETIYDVAKELADCIYVILGTALTFGIDIDKVFEEVHRSNMTKLDEFGKPVRREDGKVIKSSLYEPANIRKVLGQ